MKNFSTWMLVMFMLMFWLLRIVVSFTYETGSSFGGIEPINQTMEIILLFVVLICVILVVKRKIVGALIYLLSYGMYFGTTLITGITTLLEGGTMSASSYLNVFVAFIGIIIPVAVLIDLLMDKGRKANPRDKKTDWFYKNEKFDRKVDERADKNNYRTL